MTGGPTVSQHPAARSISAGQTLVLTATPANGYSNVTVQWRRNGVNITNGPGGGSPGGGVASGASGALASPTYASIATLTITGAMPGDSGEYDAVFTNACGTATSRPATVCISVPCPADFNLDGGVDGSDLASFFQTWAAGVCSADVNQDGGVDGSDVETFLVAWQAGGC